MAVCVPTPLDVHQQPDTSYMESSAKAIAPYLKDGVMVVLESSFTKPMFTLRYVFSRIFSISATAGLDTLVTPPSSTDMESSAKAIAPYLKDGVMVVLESTTYPGTTEELIRPILEEGAGLKCGEQFYLGFSPERVAVGNKLLQIFIHHIADVILAAIDHIDLFGLHVYA